MIDKFKEIPDTEQGIKMYINYAQKEIKSNERKNKRLQECIQEANSRLTKGANNGEQSN